MDKNQKSDIEFKPIHSNQSTLNCLNINQNNGMTRIYGTIKKDPKKTPEYFEQLVNQLSRP